VLPHRRQKAITPGEKGLRVKNRVHAPREFNRRTMLIAFVLLGGIAQAARAFPPEVAVQTIKASPEVRAIWVTRWDYRSKQDVQRAVRGAAALGLNRVFFQVRGRADAFYRSSYEPWAEELGGRDPGFDPLQVAIDEARAVGIDLDPWINVLPGWKGGRPPRSRQHVYHQHPEWFLVGRRGERYMLDKNRYTIINPCLPEVRSYLVKIVEDLASKYEFTGLHLDYVRFVARDPKRGRDFPYDPRTVALFRKFSGGEPSSRPELWDDWRRRSVNTIVYRLSTAFRKVKPEGRVSIAAIKNFQRAREGLFQDVLTWRSRGWVDEVFPMTYAADYSTFTSEVRTILSAGGAHQVFPGIGVYLFSEASELEAQADFVRRMGSRGYALFALSNFYPTSSHESSDSARAKAKRRDMRETLLRINERASRPRQTRLGK